MPNASGTSELRGRGPTQTHFDHLETFPCLALVVRHGDVREQGRVPDDGRSGIAMLMLEPLAGLVSAKIASA